MDKDTEDVTLEALDEEMEDYQKDFNLQTYDPKQAAAKKRERARKLAEDNDYGEDWMEARQTTADSHEIVAEAVSGESGEEVEGLAVSGDLHGALLRQANRGFHALPLVYTDVIGEGGAGDLFMLLAEPLLATVVTQTSARSPSLLHVLHLFERWLRRLVRMGGNGVVVFSSHLQARLSAAMDDPLHAGMLRLASHVLQARLDEASIPTGVGVRRIDGSHVDHWLQTVEILSPSIVFTTAVHPCAAVEADLLRLIDVLRVHCRQYVGLAEAMAPVAGKLLGHVVEPSGAIVRHLSISLLFSSNAHSKKDLKKEEEKEEKTQKTREDVVCEAMACVSSVHVRRLLTVTWAVCQEYPLAAKCAVWRQSTLQGRGVRVALHGSEFSCGVGEFATALVAAAGPSSLPQAFVDVLDFPLAWTVYDAACRSDSAVSALLGGSETSALSMRAHAERLWQTCGANHSSDPLWCLADHTNWMEDAPSSVVSTPDGSFYTSSLQSLPWHLPFQQDATPFLLPEDEEEDPGNAPGGVSRSNKNAASSASPSQPVDSSEVKDDWDMEDEEEKEESTPLRSVGPLSPSRSSSREVRPTALQVRKSVESLRAPEEEVVPAGRSRAKHAQMQRKQQQLYARYMEKFARSLSADGTSHIVVAEGRWVVLRAVPRVLSHGWVAHAIGLAGTPPVETTMVDSSKDSATYTLRLRVMEDEDAVALAARKSVWIEHLQNLHPQANLISSSQWDSIRIESDFSSNSNSNSNSNFNSNFNLNSNSNLNLNLNSSTLSSTSSSSSASKKSQAVRRENVSKQVAQLMQEIVAECDAVQAVTTSPTLSSDAARASELARKVRELHDRADRLQSGVHVPIGLAHLARIDRLLRSTAFESAQNRDDVGLAAQAEVGEALRGFLEAWRAAQSVTVRLVSDLWGKELTLRLDASATVAELRRRVLELLLLDEKPDYHLYSDLLGGNLEDRPLATLDSLRVDSFWFVEFISSLDLKLRSKLASKTSKSAGPSPSDPLPKSTKSSKSKHAAKPGSKADIQSKKKKSANSSSPNFSDPSQEFPSSSPPVLMREKLGKEYCKLLESHPILRLSSRNVYLPSVRDLMESVRKAVADEWGSSSVHGSARFQLARLGPGMERHTEGRYDGRVPFKPDRWQRELLDVIDRRESALVVAPTSSGKTFASFYAMRRTLRADDDGVLVFVVPNKALVNQICADLLSRFRKTYPSESRTLWGVSTSDYEYNVLSCQILVAVPSRLEELLLDPERRDWARSIRYVVFDEVHMIGGAEGAVWERLLLLVEAPFLALSATLANPEQFLAWLRCVADRKHKAALLRNDFPAANPSVAFVRAYDRYNDLRKHMVLMNHSSVVDQNLPRGGGAEAEKENAVGVKTLAIHPIALLHEEDLQVRGMPEDLNLEPADSLDLYDRLHRGMPAPGLPELEPERYFADKSPMITRVQAKAYASLLKAVLQVLAAPPARLSDALADLARRLALESPHPSSLGGVLSTLSNLSESLRGKVFHTLMQDYGGALLSQASLQQQHPTQAEQPPTQEQEVQRNPKVEEKEASKEGLFQLLRQMDREQQLPALLFGFDRTSLQAYMEYVVTRLEGLEEAESRTPKAIARRERQDAIRRSVQESLDAARKRLAKKPTSEQLKEEVADLEGQLEQADVVSTEFSFRGIERGAVQGEVHLKEEFRLARIFDGDKSAQADPFVRAIRRGIGIHHLGLPTKRRQLVEKLTRVGYLRVVFATSTLALGINVPARSAVFVENSLFLNSLQYRQMAGRAGRRGFDHLGLVFFYNVPLYKIKRLEMSHLPSLHGSAVSSPMTLLRMCLLQESAATSISSSSSSSSSSWDGVPSRRVADAMRRLYDVPLAAMARPELARPLRRYLHMSLDYLVDRGLVDASLRRLQSGAGWTALLHRFEPLATLLHPHWLELDAALSCSAAPDRVLLLLLARGGFPEPLHPLQASADLPQELRLPDLPANVDAIVAKAQAGLRARLGRYLSTCAKNRAADLAALWLPMTGYPPAEDDAALEALDPDWRSPLAYCLEQDLTSPLHGELEDLMPRLREDLMMDAAMVPLFMHFRAPQRSHLLLVYDGASLEDIRKLHHVPDAWAQVNLLEQLAALLLASFEVSYPQDALPVLRSALSTIQANLHAYLNP